MTFFNLREKVKFSKAQVKTSKLEFIVKEVVLEGYPETHFTVVDRVLWENHYQLSEVYTTSTGVSSSLDTSYCSGVSDLDK